MKKDRPPAIAVLSLGCPRNLVDSELILGALKEKSCCRVVEEIEGSDICVINTCAFIEDAKREAIDIILKACSLKKKARVKKIIVCGCLSQRYGAKLKKDIPEIDAILGIDAFKNINSAVEGLLKGKEAIKINSPRALYSHSDKRSLITPGHYAYVKIAEGCSNRCSYCVIYKIRGALRSRPSASIIKEIKSLKRLSELNIIAQDTTAYAMDNHKAPGLAALLKDICRLNRAHWIRLLYTHPRNFTDELIDVIGNEPRICKYIDLPIQHISDKILKVMNRRTNQAQIRALIDKIRRNIPDVALRTSVIVGFPGETEKDFQELLDFIKEAKFERLGAFIYSREEDTPAYNFKDQVSQKEKIARFNKVMKLQQEISEDINRNFMAKTLEVLIENKEKGVYIGRSQYDAPEVDGLVYVHSKRILKPGDFVNVKIKDTLEYDLVGDTG